MPDQPSLADIGAAAHERFARESREVNQAWASGNLDKWLQEKFADERCTEDNTATT